MNETTNETPEMLQGAPACFDYLVKKYGRNKMPLKKCTFIKILSDDTIPFCFKPAGSKRAHRWFSIVDVEDWYNQSICDKNKQ